MTTTHRPFLSGSRLPATHAVARKRTRQTREVARALPARVPPVRVDPVRQAEDGTGDLSGTARYVHRDLPTARPLPTRLRQRQAGYRAVKASSHSAAPAESPAREAMPRWVCPATARSCRA